jgi:hypothetical protein
MTTMSPVSQAVSHVSASLFNEGALDTPHAAGVSGGGATHEPGDNICPDRKWPFPGPHPHFADVFKDLTSLRGWCGNEPRPLPHPLPDPLPNPRLTTIFAPHVAELVKPHAVDQATAGAAHGAGRLATEPGDEICPPWPWPPGPWPGPQFDNVLNIGQLKQLGQQM